MKIMLANPRGFCAGVNRAIDIVERALDKFGAPIYVRHEVVHNKFVVDSLREKGAVFVDELDDVPEGGTVIFSAHGVSKAVRQEAQSRGLTVFDATCPLGTKVHMEVVRHEKSDQEVVLIGHAGHPEVEGTLGQYEGEGMYLVESPEDVAKLEVKNPVDLAYVTQTTLSVDDTTRVIDALRERFPNIHGPKKDDICYATQNRQDAVKKMAQGCDLVLVVGSANSSNSNRLRELADRLGAEAYLVDNADHVQAGWLEGKSCIGVTAGASAPEVLVEEVVERLKEMAGATAVESDGEVENIVFSLPKTLQK